MMAVTTPSDRLQACLRRYAELRDTGKPAPDEHSVLAGLGQLYGQAWPPLSPLILLVCRHSGRVRSGSGGHLSGLWHKVPACLGQV